MMKKKLIVAAMLTGVMIIAGIAATRVMAGCDMHGSAPSAAPAAAHAAHMQAPAGNAAAATTQPAADAKCLTDAVNAIEAAKKAIQSGDTKAALAQMDKAQALIIQCRESTTKPAAFANVTCPIMGSKIDPTKVPASLVREYKGKRIAFCCGGCPAQWDKLSDAEKDAKLKTK